MILRILCKCDICLFSF